MKFIPDYTHSYIKENIENVKPGGYLWIKHYLYLTEYLYNNRHHRPISVIQNIKKARSLGPLEQRKKTLDGKIQHNVILAQRELRIYYQEKYFKRPKQEVNPDAHFYWFSEHLRRASLYFEHLVQLSA